MKKTIIILAFLFLLTSCYDYHELNNLNIVNSIAIDYQNDNYIVYLEIINTSKKDESNEFKSNIISGTDSNIASAFKNAINKSDKEIYLKQSRLLLLSEVLCYKGINDTINYLLNDNTLSNNYILAITNDINNIYKNNNTKSILDTLNNNNEMDDIEKITGDLINKYKDISLPYIKTYDKQIDTNQIAYFKEDKLNDLIDKKIYEFLTKKNNNTEFTFNNNTITIYKSKIKTNIQNNNITITINGYGYINQINSQINLKDINTYKELEKELDNQINNEIKLFLNTTLNKESDILGLKNLYYKKYQKEINDISYTININIKLDKNGNIYEGLYD